MLVSPETVDQKSPFALEGTTAGAPVPPWRMRCATNAIAIAPSSTRIIASLKKRKVSAPSDDAR